MVETYIEFPHQFIDSFKQQFLAIETLDGKRIIRIRYGRNVKRKNSIFAELENGMLFHALLRSNSFVEVKFTVHVLINKITSYTKHQRNIERGFHNREAYKRSVKSIEREFPSDLSKEAPMQSAIMDRASVAISKKDECSRRQCKDNVDILVQVNMTNGKMLDAMDAERHLATLMLTKREERIRELETEIEELKFKIRSTPLPMSR